MTIMPHVDATGILVHTPVTHGHFITVVATGKEKITKEMALEAFEKHPRIRVVTLEEGFMAVSYTHLSFALNIVFATVPECYSYILIIITM